MARPLRLAQWSSACGLGALHVGLEAAQPEQAGGAAGALRAPRWCARCTPVPTSRNFRQQSAQSIRRPSGRSRSIIWVTGCLLATVFRRMPVSEMQEPVRTDKACQDRQRRLGKARPQSMPGATWPRSGRMDAPVSDDDLEECARRNARWPARPSCRSCRRCARSRSPAPRINVAHALLHGRRPRPGRGRRRPAGRRAARPSAANGFRSRTRQHQSVAAAAERRHAREPDRVRAGRHRARAEPRRRLERARRPPRSIAVWLVTTLPDVPPGRICARRSRGAPGARRPRHRAVDLCRHAGDGALRHRAASRSPSSRARSTLPLFDPQARAAGARRRAAQGLARSRPDDRIVLVPGRVAPWNGQVLLPDMARDAGRTSGIAGRDVSSSPARTSSAPPLRARVCSSRRRTRASPRLFRLTGHCADMPAAFAAADVVAVPAHRSRRCSAAWSRRRRPWARPVVTSDVGMLPGACRGAAAHAGGRAHRLGGARPAIRSTSRSALELRCRSTTPPIRRCRARARQFAEYMFSPESVAEATRAVYTSLLARDL